MAIAYHTHTFSVPTADAADLLAGTESGKVITPDVLGPVTPAGKALLSAANVAAQRAALDLEPGTDVQAYDADLTALAGLDKSDGNIIVGNGTAWVAESGATARASLGLIIGTDVQAYSANLTEYAAVNPTTAGLALLDDVDASAQRTTLGLAIGTDVQAHDADLTAIGALAKTDGNFIVGNGTTWVAESGATARGSLGLGTADSPQYTAIELGHATDTTIARASAGRIAVEGVGVLLETDVRVRLTSNRTYYVRTDGSDSNDGLTNTSGGAFLTIAKAISVVSALDLSVYNVTIQLQDTTWGEAVNVSAAWVGAGVVTLRGASNACVLNAAAALTVRFAGSKLTIRDITIGGSATGLVAQDGGAINVGANVIFAGTGFHVRTNSQGSVVTFTAPYSITSGGACHFFASPSGFINCYNLTVTLSGTLNFSSAFAVCERGGLVSANSSTFSGGTITGTRYSVSTNGVIYTAGAGASHFPGNVSGTTATGGQYA